MAAVKRIFKKLPVAGNETRRGALAGCSYGVTVALEARAMMFSAGLTAVESDAGFIYSMDRPSLRRQWRISLALVVILTMAIASAAVSIGSFPATVHSAGVLVPNAFLHADRTAVDASRS